MFDHNGNFMCFIAEKRMHWYLKKNLADQINETDIKLNFIPQGSGYRDDDYYTEVRENKCVVCGVTENLTKHHVVPHQYRRFFPDQYKNRTHFDVLMVCQECHYQYESHATDLNKQICLEYDVPFYDERFYRKTDKNIKLRGLIEALDKHLDRMPLERINNVLEHISTIVGYPVTLSNYKDIQLKKNTSLMTAKKYRYSQLVVEKLPDVFSFIVRWRKHFLEVMNPKHLSKTWWRDHTTKQH